MDELFAAVSSEFEGELGGYLDTTVLDSLLDETRNLLVGAIEMGCGVGDCVGNTCGAGEARVCVWGYGVLFLFFWGGVG